jgi:hypothetical protein
VALTMDGKTSPDEVLRVTHNEDEVLETPRESAEPQKGAA